MTTYITGAAVGLKSLPGLVFELEASYTGCMICGSLYQSILDRKIALLVREPDNPLNCFLDGYIIQAEKLRKEWAKTHSKSHPQEQHDSLKKSGQFCTPEAALKLAPYGIFPLDSSSDEVDHAMLEAPRAPLDDVEGT